MFPYHHREIVDWSTEESMAIYGKLLLLVAVVNCLDIDLSQQILTEVPSNIDSGVTNLNLQHNQIKEINSTSLMAFQDLLILNLEYNLISHISEEAFDHNPKLTELLLQGNRIDSMTSSFGAARGSLTAISLYRALTQEGINTLNLSRCVSLQQLNIGDNGYQTLDATILPKSLVDLSMKFNGLETIPDLTHQTPYMKTLILKNNVISSIPTEIIQGLKHLKLLHIAGNSIHILPDLIGTSIKEIYLKGNPIACNTSVCDLRKLYDMGILHILDEPECETPEAYKGQRVLAMNISTLGCPAAGKFIAT